MFDMPQVSIIVPTHNRAQSLLRTLSALAVQDYPMSLIEVVVVADGCTDETAQSVAALKTDYRLAFLAQNNLGPSGARNTGAAHATGSLLIFIDDDVEPGPGLVTAHVSEHRKARVRDMVVLGYYPTRATFQTGFYRASLIHWWESIFEEMEGPAHRFRYVDMLSGNFSIGRDLFKRVGGFDRVLRCHEDYELGIRLIRAGAAFAFSREAWGHHYETSDFRRSISRKFEEGRADIHLARMYPELLAGLPLARRGRSVRLIRAFAGRGRLRQALERVLDWCVETSEAFRLRRTWLRFLYRRFDLAYWRGATSEAGGASGVDRILAGRKPAPGTGEPLPEADLLEGIEAIEARLDAARPGGLFVHYGGEPIGTLVHDAWRERLHGGHLRPWLAVHHPYNLMRAMASAKAKRHLAGQQSPPDHPFPHTSSAAIAPLPSLITVVIPAHNAAETLRRTVASLQAQTYRRWEAVIVNDGSTDDTQAVIEDAVASDSRFRTTALEGVGAAAARNAGIALARGHWLLFLDADDTIDPAMMSRMIAALHSFPNADAAHCGWRCVDPAGAVILTDCSRLSGDLFPQLAHRAPFVIHSCLVRTDAVRAAGGFDASMTTNEDFDLWQRIARRGARFVSVPDVMVTYHMRENQTWFSAGRHVRDALRVIARGHETREGDERPGAPRTELPARVLYLLAYAGGIAIGQGQATGEPLSLGLDFLKQQDLQPSATLDPEACADSLLVSVPLSMRRPRTDWPQIWDGVSAPIAELFGRLEELSGFEGAAEGALRALERKIAELRTDEGRTGGAARMRIDAEAPLGHVQLPGAHTLVADIVYAGSRMGTVTLPVIDDQVVAEVLADEIARQHGWAILQAFFARSMFSEGPSARAYSLADHNEEGWDILLGEIWRLPQDEQARLYDALPPVAPDQRAQPATVELGGAPADISAPQGESPDALPIAYRIQGEPEASLWVPASGGRASRQAIAARLTQEAGFDLCRIVVREAILGRPAHTGERLADRLSRGDGVAGPPAGAALLARWPALDGRTWPQRGALPLALLDRVAATVPAGLLERPQEAPSAFIYRPGRMAAPAPTADAHETAAGKPYEQVVRGHFESLFESDPDPWAYTSSYEQTKYEQTLSLIPAPAPADALELACAEGIFTAMLAPKVGHLKAVDISRTALERARARTGDSGNVTFAQHDLASDPIEGVHDLILCSEVLYYLESREVLDAVVARIASALRPGGAFIQAHARVLVDEPGHSGFDWTVPFGARTICEAFASHPELTLEAEISTPLYRIQRYRRTGGDEAVQGDAAAQPLVSVAPYALPTPEVGRHIRWNGGHVSGGLAAAGNSWTMPILMYHRIAADGIPALERYRTDPDAFEQQLRLLRKAGYESATIPEWRRACRAGTPMPGKRVILTFDDGFQDFHDEAWPLLKKYGFSATVFLVTDRVGDASRWDERYGGAAPLMDWDAIRALSAEGVTFASHGATHRGFTTLSNEDLADELLRSRLAIEEKTGRPVTTLCYPYGMVNGTVEQIATACGYSEAVSVWHALSPLDDKPMRLRRLEVRRDIPLDEFRRQLG